MLPKGVPVDIMSFLLTDEAIRINRPAMAIKRPTICDLISFSFRINYPKMATKTAVRREST